MENLNLNEKQSKALGQLKENAEVIEQCLVDLEGYLIDRTAHEHGEVLEDVSQGIRTVHDLKDLIAKFV